MSICPRGYLSSRKYFYPFPTKQALEYAQKVCQGEAPDHTGLVKISKHNYLDFEIHDVNGFSRRHAEAWINVCTGHKCLDHDLKTCHPSKRIDSKTSMTITEMSKKQLHDLCSNYRTDYPDITVLMNKIHRAGFIPSKQLIHDGQTIGILDMDGQLHISQPSPPLKDLDRYTLV
jgi:hypothetical protein